MERRVATTQTNGGRLFRGRRNEFSEIAMARNEKKRADNNDSELPIPLSRKNLQLGGSGKHKKAH